MSQLSCPRCSRPLYPELDPDYGSCLIHGSQYLGTIPDLDMLKGSRPGGLSSGKAESTSKLKEKRSYIHDD